MSKLFYGLNFWNDNLAIHLYVDLYGNMFS